MTDAREMGKDLARFGMAECQPGIALVRNASFLLQGKTGLGQSGVDTIELCELALAPIAETRLARAEEGYDVVRVKIH